MLTSNEARTCYISAILYPLRCGPFWPFWCRLWIEVLRECGVVHAIRDTINITPLESLLLSLEDDNVSSPLSSVLSSRGVHMVSASLVQCQLCVDAIRLPDVWPWCWTGDSRMAAGSGSRVTDTQ